MHFRFGCDLAPLQGVIETRYAFASSSPHFEVVSVLQSSIPMGSMIKVGPVFLARGGPELYVKDKAGGLVLMAVTVIIHLGRLFFGAIRWLTTVGCVTTVVAIRRRDTIVRKPLVRRTTEDRFQNFAANMFWEFLGCRKAFGR